LKGKICSNEKWQEYQGNIDEINRLNLEQEEKKEINQRFTNTIGGAVF
jgi:hypothetical protein